MRESKKQRRTHCSGCTKSDLKKRDAYYRDGKYYCNKSHWRRMKKAEDEKNEKKNS